VSVATGQRILTQEELHQLLSGRAESPSVDRDERLAPRLPRSVAPKRSSGDAALRLAIAQGADSWGRRMASSYQRRIECSLIGWQEMDPSDLAPAILDVDEIVRFEVAAEPGFVLMSRPLFTALLGLEFGAGSTARPSPLPRRRFSGIERRLLKRLVRDLLALLEGACREGWPHAFRITGTCGRERLLEEATGRMLVASFDVSALDVIGRLRVGLPVAAFQAQAAEADARPPGGPDRLQEGMADVPLTLRAELGTLELTLAQIARLRVGDELSVRPSAQDGLLIRIAGKAKFRAVAGQVGNRLAAQAVERL